MYSGIEQRDFERNTAEAPMVFADWNSHNWKKGGICNFSQGGLNFESNTLLQPGEDIFIKIENFMADILENAGKDMPLRAEVVWCKESAKEYTPFYEIGAKYTEKFWEKSYDEGISHLDPESWEASYIDIIRPTFDEFHNKPAFHYIGKSVTFADLDQYSNKFANMLILNGFKKGDVMGINLPNIPEYIIAWLGTLKAGCVVTGVSPLLSNIEMEHQLKDSDAKGLVTLDAIFAGRVVFIEQNLPNLKLIITANVGDFLPGIKRAFGKLLGKIPKGKVMSIEGKTVENFKKVIKSKDYSAMYSDIHIAPDDIAYIQYTGGTTGLPKGAMLSHRNSVSNMLVINNWLNWERGKGQALSGFPFFHIAGLHFNLCCIYMGFSQILIPNPRDTDYICSELAKYRPSVLVNVPSLYQLLIKNPKFKSLDHSHLETCVSAASPFPEESQKMLESIVGEDKLLEAYGMTETAPLTTANPSKGKKKLGSIGVPLLNTDLKLVDPETGNEVDIGVPGEICVRGPQVMKGYYKKPEETENAIDSDGFMHTGDVAVFDDQGYLYIVDRLKDMIIVGGYKVFSKKVEEILAEHMAIDMIALIGDPNPDRPGSEVTRAYVSIHPDYEFNGDYDALEEEIMQFAREKLAPYEVPKIIEFKEEMPLTSVGKIDKKVLRKKVKE